jgi:hypothetical protein
MISMTEEYSLQWRISQSDPKLANRSQPNARLESVRGSDVAAPRSVTNSSR